jgi:hypothetical protein
MKKQTFEILPQEERKHLIGLWSILKMMLYRIIFGEMPLMIKPVFLKK